MTRVQVLPEPDDQLAFVAEGKLCVRWHFSRRYPRPFFYPVLDPDGHPLTRMGHPAAPDHDHHRSVWFGHHSVAGVNFWTEGQGTQQIRQTAWIHYQDGDDVGVAVVRLGWFDSHGVKLLSQDLVIALQPLEHGEYLLELQSEFRPEPQELALGRTNFGFLGVRVARSVSALFGEGQLVDSEGRVGEKRIFGQVARWVDYSGPTAAGSVAGITYMDHPSNSGHPSHWHVRDDGWMVASVCMSRPIILARGQVMRLRYGLYVHRDRAPAARIREVWERFASSAPWRNIGPRPPYRLWYERAS